MIVKPLKARFGATITDVKLATISDDDFTQLSNAWLDHALLIFPGQHLSKAEQIAFAERFGPLELECVPISNMTRE